MYVVLPPHGSDPAVGQNFSHHLGISIMAFAVLFTHYAILLLLTSRGDPGIISRNAHPPEPEGFNGNVDVGAVKTPQGHNRMGKAQSGKFMTCLYLSWRNLLKRAVLLLELVHCSYFAFTVQPICDTRKPKSMQEPCLQDYRFFFMFVFSTTLLCMYVFGFSWVYIRRIMASEETTTWRAMIQTPTSIVLIVYTFISMWFVGGLTAFHLYLISTNQIGVIIAVSCFYRQHICSSIPLSKNNFRAKVPREPVLPTRPGDFMSPIMGDVVGDIEMGRKGVWGQLTGECVNVKEDELGELTPETSTADDMGDHAGIHPRQSN
ncbi:hypothetical protein V6Z11_D07G261400 [Gossypium hirsutum]